MSDSNDPGSPPSPTSPSREAIITVIVTIGLLAGLVWYIRPARVDFKPAPLEELPEECQKINRPFVPSNVTDIQDPPLTGLGAHERLVVLRRLNFEPCPCGCNQSIAECRANHPQCKVSRSLAEKVVSEVRDKWEVRK